jgi:hypothetical protein
MSINYRPDAQKVLLACVNGKPYLKQTIVELV